MKLIRPSFEILSIHGGDLQLINTARSTCYKSLAQVDKADDNIRLAIKQGHETLIEHGGMSVRFIVDRGFTHELVRHRMAVYSQESTRWCNYSGEMTFIIPPWLKLPEGVFQYTEDLQHIDRSVDLIWIATMMDTERRYRNLIMCGWKPEQARSILPNSLKTEIIMTANFREWRLVFKQRALGLTGKPHPQMLEIMVPLLEEARELVPAVFGDLK